MLLKLNKLYFLYKKSIFILNLFLLINFIQLKGQETKWHNLLQNNNLNEFVQLNGKANFTLKNGVLIGTSKLNTPNSFLATKTKYSNFILSGTILRETKLLNFFKNKFCIFALDDKNESEISLKD